MNDISSHIFVDAAICLLYDWLMRETLQNIIRTKKKFTKLIHEGEYAAEVDINLLITDDDWSPYLSLEDAYKLDDVRQALR